MNFVLKIILVLISINMFAQSDGGRNLVLEPSIKNQTDLAKKYISKYLRNELPRNMKDCTGYFLRGSDYHFLLSQGGSEIFKKIFKYSEHRRFPTTDNQFSFSYNDIGDVCERVYGYCHGHTAALSLWNRMAYFDEANTLKQQIPSPNDSEKWHQFYYELIDNIMYNRNVIVVPGFKNLYEFSKATPQITRYLKEHIALIWAKANVNFSGATKVLRSIYNKFDEKEALKLHHDLKYKIETLGYAPIVFVTSESVVKTGLKLPSNAGIHVMQAYKITEIDQNGKFQISFWDLDSPRDARDATSIYEIEIKEGKSYTRQITGSRFDKRKNGDETYHYDFADIEEVPFGDIQIGSDAVKTLNFFDKNPNFVDFLEKQFIERKLHPPRAYFPPFKGDIKTIPPLLLKDSTKWHWKIEDVDEFGKIYIDDYLIKKLPAKVKKELERLNPQWMSDSSFDPYSQYPEPLKYSTKNDPRISEFRWPVDWINWSGEAVLPHDYEKHLPPKFIDFLNESYINLKNTKTIDTKKINPVHRSLYLYERLVVIKMDFFDNDGKFYIPSEYVNSVDPMMKQLFLDMGIWPIKRRFEFDFLKAISTHGQFSFGAENWRLPFSYYRNDNMIKIPKGVEVKWPSWVRSIFCGFNPNSNCPKEFDFNILSYIHSQIPIRDTKSSTYSLPITWFMKDETSKGYMKDYMIEVPESEYEYIPDELKILFFGKTNLNGSENRSFLARPMTLVLKSGKYYTFPMSWISVKEGSEPRLILNIPSEDDHLVPEIVKNEIFSVGPIQYELDRDIDITGLQDNVYWYQPRESEQWKPILFPREWMQRFDDGNIIMIIPSVQSEIDLYLSAEVQEYLKSHEDYFSPGMGLFISFFNSQTSVLRKQR